jgi:hypothetical protein
MAKGFIILSSIVTVTVIYISKQVSKRNVLLIGIVILVFTVFFIKKTTGTPGESLAKSLRGIYTYAIIDQARIQDAEIGRIGVLKLGWQKVSTDIPHILLGLGPGTFRKSVFGMNQSLKTINNWLWRSKLSAGTREANTVLMQWGLLGHIVLILIFIGIWRLNKSFYLKNQDPYWKGISIGFFGMIILFIFGPLYGPVMSNENTAVPFWIIAGIIYKLKSSVSFSEQ